MKILLIEDNAANAAIYRQVLQQQGGYEVLHTANGLDGLRAAWQDTFAAILIDFDLPDVPGLHVGLALYHGMRRGQLKPTALIALTAHSDTATQAEAEQAGFDAFIAKPCTDLALLDAVRQLTGGGSCS